MMPVSAPTAAKPEARQRTSPAKWWLPSMAEIVFASVLLWLLLGGQASALLADGDTGWHIRTGDYILSRRTVPRTDLFSFSRPGAPWFAWEWGSDVLFSLAHKAAGLKGVVLLAGILIAATSALLVQYMLWLRVNIIVAVLAALIAASASTMHWLARPHLFTGLLFVIIVWLLEADRSRNTAWVWTLVPMAALWANLHGGFLIMIAVLGLYATASALEKTISPGKNWKAAGRYAGLAGLCVLATLINPYGFRLHEHIWQYVRSDFIRDHVQEFQGPSFRGESMFAFELLLVAGLLSAPSLWRRGERAPALVLLALAHAALGSVRHVLLYVAAAAPLAAREATRMLESARGVWPGTLARLAADYAPQTDGASKFHLPWRACAPVALAWALLNSGPALWQADFPATKFPLAAINRAEKILVGRKVFTSDQWADYLIYRFYPRERVFVDGRSDFYGAAIGQDYLDAQQARYRWNEVFQRFGLEMALVSPEEPIATVLKIDPGWRVVCDDGQAVVLEKVQQPSPR
jgi:hypothetical protein